MQTQHIKRISASVGITAGGTLAVALGAALALHNLGGILALFLESGGELDFIAIFSQLEGARISPHWLLPLLLFAAFAALLLFFPPKGSKKALWIALYTCGGVVLLLVSYTISLLLCRVNDVRFLDLLRALIPVIGSL